MSLIPALGHAPFIILHPGMSTFLSPSVGSSTLENPGSTPHDGNADVSVQKSYSFIFLVHHGSLLADNVVGGEHVHSPKDKGRDKHHA